jgi:hypothetical protein
MHYYILINNEQIGPLSLKKTGKCPIFRQQECGAKTRKCGKTLKNLRNYISSSALLKQTNNRRIFAGDAEVRTLSTYTGKIIGAVLSFGFGIYGTLNGNHWYDKLLGLAFVIGSILYTIVQFMEYKENRDSYEFTFLEYRQSGKN